MRNLIKKILKESKDGLVLHIGEIVIVNGTFQDKEFNNKIGTVKYFKADGDIVGIEFEGWTGGHDGRISFRRNTGSIWEFFTSRKALKIYGYTIKPVDIDSDKFFISEQEENEIHGKWDNDTYVLYDNKGRIGSGTLYPFRKTQSGFYVREDGNTQHTLMGLSVYPTYRGKGYGKEIIKQIENRCLEKGIDRLYILVEKNNPAVKLYRSMGYEEIPTNRAYLTFVKQIPENTLKESEDDFDWVEIPEVPKMHSYVDKVRYALLNTEFQLKCSDVCQIWLNHPTDKEMSGVMVSERGPYFKHEIILSDVKNTVDNHKLEWYHPYYVKLYNILKQIPENTLKESEEEFGWVEKEEDFLPTDKAIAIWMEDLTPQEVDRVMAFLRDYNKWAFLKRMMKRHDWAGSSKPIRNSLSVLILHPDGGISAWTHGGNVVTQRNMWDDMVEKNQGELRIVDAQDILKIY